MAHRSRWGWHSCDYQTFLVLKELNKLCERAQHLHAAWCRWQRKAPHNRVSRRAVVDEQGHKVGREVVGPRPEPPLPALFCVRRSVRTLWSADGKPLKEGRLVEKIEFADHGIPEAYRVARKPAATEAEVVALRLTAEEVRRLLERAQGGQ
jgi:hypothetical protein